MNTTDLCDSVTVHKDTRIRYVPSIYNNASDMTCYSGANEVGSKPAVRQCSGRTLRASGESLRLATSLVVGNCVFFKL